MNTLTTAQAIIAWAVLWALGVFVFEMLCSSLWRLNGRLKHKSWRGLW